MTELPYITDDLLGIGGHLKQTPADFVVEEIPVYEPGGAGEHLFLWIEKEDVSAEELVARLARSLDLRREEIGVAGLKDRRAVTRQYVSVPASREATVERFTEPDIRVLSAKRHENKLKTGHLRGNRFAIRIREPRADAMRFATPIAERLRTHGLPNFYGEQRFGHDRQTLALGLALLRGEKRPQSIPPARRKFLLRLALSAAQSEFFNRALIDRLRREEFETVLAGDVMRKTDSGGLFVVDEPDDEQSRFDAREIDITGPVFGPKMKLPLGEVAEREAEILSAAGLSLDAFRQYKKLTPGTRRPYRVPLTDLDVSHDTEGLRITVSLPAGSYATILTREFMKPE